MTHKLPPIPTERDFTPGTFWHTYRAKFARVKTPKPAAIAWYESQQRKAQEAGAVFPPAPKFSRVGAMRPIPQPWTGRDERPGRVPRK